MALVNVLFPLVRAHGAVGARTKVSTAHSACHIMGVPSDIKAVAPSPWHTMRGRLDWRLDRV